MTLSPRIRDLLLLSGVCFLCFFWRLGAIGLFDFNEGLYVQAAREMYLRGDYITPRVNGLFFFDKPPLALWSAALSFALFGVSEFAARLPVALAASGMVLLTYLLGARLFGRLAGLLGGAMLALNILVFGTARQMTMDIHQSFWFAVSMTAFYAAYTGQGKAKRWYYLLWAACGIGFLAKSVPSLFALPAALIFMVWDEKGRWPAIWARLREARIPGGLLILAGIIAPWHVLVSRANGPVFYEQYWLDHHVRLLDGTDFGHGAPIWAYVPYLFIGLFPWSVFIPAALIDSVRRLRRASPGDAAMTGPNSSAEDERGLRFTLAWAGFVFVVFSLMTSKLISYLLPAYPAMALITGRWMAGMTARLPERPRFRAASLCVPTGLLAVVSVVGFAATTVAARNLRPIEAQEFPPAAWLWTLPGMAGGAVVTAAAAVMIYRGLRPQGVALLFAGMSAFIGLAVTKGLASLSEHLTSPLHSMAREAGRRMAGGERLAIYIGRPRHPSVFFYLPAAAFANARLNECSPRGIVEEFQEPEQMREFLAQGRPALILTDARRAWSLMRATPGLRIVRQQSRWIVIRAEPLPGLARQAERQANGNGL